MISFMVLAAPRSGTAWAANWLTTEVSLCLHDPLFEVHYEQLDELSYDGMREIGIACTGAALFPDWVAQHPARKVILHRDVKEINVSLHGIGAPPLQREYPAALQRIPGLHVDWRNLFSESGARQIWQHLLPTVTFCSTRFDQLKKLNVQRQYEQIVVNREATQRLIRELRAVEAMG